MTDDLTKLADELEAMKRSRDNAALLLRRECQERERIEAENARLRDALAVVAGSLKAADSKDECGAYASVAIHREEAHRIAIEAAGAVPVAYTPGQREWRKQHREAAERAMQKPAADEKGGE